MATTHKYILTVPELEAVRKRVVTNYTPRKNVVQTFQDFTNLLFKLGLKTCTYKRDKHVAIAETVDSTKVAAFANRIGHMKAYADTFSAKSMQNESMLSFLLLLSKFGIVDTDIDLSRSIKWTRAVKAFMKDEHDQARP